MLYFHILVIVVILYLGPELLIFICVSCLHVVCVIECAFLLVDVFYAELTGDW